MQKLLIAPQCNEFDYLLEGFVSKGYKTDNILFGSIEGAKIPELEIMVATGGHGKAQFAAQTQYLISRLPNVGLVICVGASGSLVEALSIGDVIVATNTIEHDYQLRFTEEPLPVHSGHLQSIDQLQNSVKKTHFPFGIYFGRIASGDEDIIDPERTNELHAETDALCVAWEGSGGARAAALSNLPFLEIRVVTDTSNVSAAENFQKNLANTIPNITSLLVQWLEDGAE